MLRFFDTNHIIALLSPSSKHTFGFHPTTFSSLLALGSAFEDLWNSMADLRLVTSSTLFAKSSMLTSLRKDNLF